ncbi:MAG: hypothetical protein IKW08_08545 [Roseburia sp.]|nr:hypothetical protein [Roseburia sp.]
MKFFRRILTFLFPTSKTHAENKEVKNNSKEEKEKYNTESPERIHGKVAKEDFLLKQIDEFRDKAKQLQDLLISKECKVQELQFLVNEREGKANELAQILTERQEQADLIMKDFNKKVDELSEKLTNKMTDIEESIAGQVSDVKNVSMEQIEANRKLSEEQVATNKKFLEEQAVANKKLGEEQLAEVKQLLDSTAAQLDSIKTDLSEKVHTENVKCYRNIQDLFNEFDSKIEKMDTMEKNVESVRGYVKCLTWFSVVNFVLLTAFILFSLGVFKF